MRMVLKKPAGSPTVSVGDPVHCRSVTGGVRPPLGWNVVKNDGANASLR